MKQAYEGYIYHCNVLHFDCFINVQHISATESMLPLDGINAEMKAVKFLLSVEVNLHIQ